MKKQIHLLICLFTFCFTINSFASSTNNFKFLMQLQKTTEESEIARVILNYDILSSCESPNLGDIRLFDSNGNETPYVIYNSQIKPTFYKFDFKFISYAESFDQSEIIIENIFEKECNQINFTIPSKNFEKQIVIYQSDDKTNWKELSKDSIYDYSMRLPLRKVKINFPNSVKTKYLKMKLKNSATFLSSKSINLNFDQLKVSLNNSSIKNFKIKNIQGTNSSKAFNNDLYDLATLKKIKSNVIKDNITEIILPKFNFDIQQLIFEVQQNYFFRDIKIYHAKKDSSKIYSFVSNDCIYNLLEVNKNKPYINLQRINNTCAKIHIINKDNPLLEINQITLKWKKKNLFFFPQTNLRYTLYFGNKNHTKPRYEVAKLLSSSNHKLFNYPTFKLRELEKNQNYSKKLDKTLKENIQRIIFTVIVICIITILGYWLYSLIKKIEKDNLSN